MSNPEAKQEDIEQPFFTHLVELRDRLLRVVLAVLIVFLALFYFANDLYHIVATPLLKELPTGASMISTKPAGTFFTPMKLAMMLSLFAAMPVILYQLWAFIAPGLYAHERKLVFPLLVASTILFYLGMAFAYFVVFPLMFQFFVAVAPEGVTVMTDISEYLDFILKILFAFGVAFEVPIVTILLVWTGVTTPDALAEKRPYIIVGAFVVGMLLTPPDVISQTLLALPMWALFEGGLFASRYFLRLKQQREEELAEEEPDLDTPEGMDAELDRYIAEEEAILRGGDSKDEKKDDNEER